MARGLLFIAASAFVWTCVSCGALVSSRVECERDEDCEADALCFVGVCEPRGVFKQDAGRDLVDAGAPEAGPEDAGPEDAGLPDAGLPDAGRDAGLADAGLVDGGPDGGVWDAGLLDAGLDAGPDGGVDAGPPWHVPDATHRMRLVIPGARLEDLGQDDETLTDVPVLVRLDADDVPPSPSAAGADLRFYADDGTLLAHEVEAWQPQGTSIVWVKLPGVPLSGTDVGLWLYAGAPSPPEVPAAASVWSRYRFVAHLRSGTTAADATTNHAPGQCSRPGSYLPIACAPDDPPALVSGGPLGEALRFDPSRGHLHFGEGSDLDVEDGQARTFSVWFYVEPGTTEPQALYYRENLCRGVSLTVVDGELSGRHGQTPEPDENCPIQNFNFAEVSVPSGAWRYGVLVVDRTGSEIVMQQRVFAADSDSSSDSNSNASDPGQPANAGHLRVGASWNGGERLNGQLDELRVFDGAESLAWTTLQHRSMRDVLFTYGAWQSAP